MDRSTVYLMLIAVFLTSCVNPSNPTSTQYKLGTQLLKEKGNTEKQKEGFKYIWEAAQEGSARAQWRLGLCYDQGEGVSQNDKEALKWYRKASSQGYAQASFNLSMHYFDSQDAREGLEWLRLAAEQGHEGAKYMMRRARADGLL